MFLKKVYTENKFLFYVFLVFCAEQFFFMYKGVQNTPFFLYGMYSEKQVPQAEYIVPIIEIDGEPFNFETLPYANREMIAGSLERYRGLEKNNFNDTILKSIEKRFASLESFEAIVRRLSNDSTDRVPYRKWLKRYLEQSTGRKINSLKVFTGTVSYKPDLQLAKRELLFEIE